MYKSAVLVLIFAYVVEIIQIFKIPQRLGFEQNAFLDLTLGSTFDWNDILAYSLGILTVVLMETLAKKMAVKRSEDQSISP